MGVQESQIPRPIFSRVLFALPDQSYTKNSIASGGRVIDSSVIHSPQETDMESIIVEIRAGEGGEDAKLLVRDTLAIYAKACSRSRL